MALVWPHASYSQETAQDGGGRGYRTLYLEVIVNGISANLIAEFREEADGRLSIEPEQLGNVGIAPAAEARGADGLIQINQLPGVSVEYDELTQTISFTAADDQRSARAIDATETQGGGRAGSGDAAKPQSSFGALLNYSLVASTHNHDPDKRFHFGGLSGSFEARLFSPYGVFSQTFVASTSNSTFYDSTRLDSTWSYSDSQTMNTYRAGDFITGGLSWTRPVRLGGLQIQRNFGLRPDLVTIPVPELSGSAAVPSTVEVYLNNARRFSGTAPAGPFEITNLPVVTGSGTTRLVVRDAQGQEVVTESAFFTSSHLLAPGLFDYSADLGFARRFYGHESNSYDGRLMATGSLRYGLTNWLTLEGHAEGGQDLLNAGAGAVFGVGHFGVASFSGASSYTPHQRGYQLTGSVELDLWGLYVTGRMQRTFGDYNDIASIVSRGHGKSADAASILFEPPRALDQLSVSIPLIFDPSNLNVSFTQLETPSGQRHRLGGVSYSRPFIGGSTLSVSGFKDFDENRYGVFASLSLPLGGGISSSSSVSSRSGDLAIMTDISRAEGQKIGDYGWRLRHSRGDKTASSATASYRSSAARLAARVDQQDDRYRASASVEGAVVAVGGGIFASNRINDAFSVVDAGAPGIEVRYENRPVGRTDASGKLLIPRLRSHENNRISIDPSDLPLDAVINSTREVVVPADRSGVVVKFDVNASANAALVTLRDIAGDHIEMGAVGRLGQEGELFVIGYDGQAFVEGLASRNRITVERLNGAICIAELAYEPGHGEQVRIPDVVCE